MKAEEIKETVILTDFTENIIDIVTLLKTEIPSKYKKRNVIVNLSKFTTLSLEELLLFLEISNTHRASIQSFILINNKMNPADVPDEMIVVPTLQEAQDIIEMEEIERDLGF